jgi:hypothetical protein
VKIQAISNDRELRRVLPERLNHVFPGSRIHLSKGNDNTESQPDLVFDVNLSGRKYRFAVEAKAQLHHADIERAARENRRGAAVPLLATVRLSDSLLDECRKRRLACFDCNGRAWIERPGLSVFRDTNKVSFRLAQPVVSPFSPKSQRLARLLLNHGDQAWGQVKLAKETGISLGLVSRLLHHYETQGWVKGHRNDWQLANQDALLDAWVAADQWSKRIDLQEYDFLEPDKATFAGKFYRYLGGAFSIAYTQWLAATLRHAYGNVPVVSAYCGRFPTVEEEKLVGLRRVTGGGKIWLLQPVDSGVFRETREVNGIPLVSDAQIYLDLLQVGLRGPDQAAALRKWEGFCR